MSSIVEELQRRTEFFSAIDKVFEYTFQMHPENTKKRILRDKVHVALTAPLGMKRGWAPTKRLINEYLYSRGVKPLVSRGRYYFTCLEFKNEQR